MPKKTTEKSTKKTSKETIKKKNMDIVEKKTKKKTSIEAEIEEPIKEEVVKDDNIEKVQKESKIVINEANSTDLTDQKKEINDSAKIEEDIGKSSSETDQKNTSNAENDTIKMIEQDDEEIEIIEDSNAEANFQDKFSNIDITDENALKDMLKDFSDMQNLGVNELLELQKAMEEVKQGIIESPKEAVISDSINAISNNATTVDGVSVIQEIPVVEDLYPGWGIYEEAVVLTQDMEAKIQAELEKKKKKRVIVTEEIFKKYCSNKRNKVWYHALWFLIFTIEDHEATKQSLYEALCNVTSKSAIDPLPEHTFYFGLINILRLSLNDRKIIEFTGDKLKINKLVGIDLLTDLLREIGPPISERPVISEEKKKDMFMKFLTDDFLDI